MHIPVLTEDVIAELDPQQNQNFIDCTLGGAGHTKAILERTAPKGRVLGIEWDTETLQNTKNALQQQGLLPRVLLANENFARIQAIVKETKFPVADGIVMDLGFSSLQLEESGRGFSLKKKEPLDMRMNADIQITAAKIVNYQSRQELEHILKTYGEEQFATAIAKAIVKERSEQGEIQTTTQLVSAIEQAVPGWYRRQRLHFATKTFQALRIAVNGELENLETALPQIEQVIKPGGKVAIISFHSLEDRIVKQFFKAHEDSFEIVTKKPITPSTAEIKRNPRARSAKLRAAKKR